MILFLFLFFSFFLPSYAQEGGSTVDGVLYQQSISVYNEVEYDVAPMSLEVGVARGLAGGLVSPLSELGNAGLAISNLNSDLDEIEDWIYQTSGSDSGEYAENWWDNQLVEYEEYKTNQATLGVMGFQYGIDLAKSGGFRSVLVTNFSYDEPSFPTFSFSGGFLTCSWQKASSFGPVAQRLTNISYPSAGFSFYYVRTACIWLWRVLILLGCFFTITRFFGGGGD